MSDKETAETFQFGLDLLLNHSRTIAMLPLEEWDRAFEHAETVGPILDPTLYWQYLSSRNGPVIRDIIRAAIQLKSAVEKGRKAIQESQPQTPTKGNQ